MNEQDILGRLASLGTDGPPLVPAQDALRAGRKARTRRRVLGAGGSALSLGVVVALVLTLSPSPGGTDTVIAADGGTGASSGDDPASERLAPRTVRELDGNADAHNAAILQEALGEEWTIDSDRPAGTVRDGSAAASRLPEGMEASVRMSAGVATDAALPQYCAKSTEKGTVTRVCVDRELPDGTVVQEQTSYWGPMPDQPQETSGQGLRMFYRQPNGVLVFADLYLGGPAEDPTSKRQRAAREWVDSWADRLGAAVSHPDVKADSFIQADADPDPSASDKRSVAKPEDLCPRGVDHKVKPKIDWPSEPPTDPDSAFRHWVADADDDAIERAAVKAKDPNKQRYAYVRRDDNGRARSVVEISPITKGEYYTITTVYMCK